LGPEGPPFKSGHSDHFRTDTCTVYPYLCSAVAAMSDGQNIIVLSERCKPPEEPSHEVCTVRVLADGEVLLWLSDEVTNKVHFNWLIAKITAASASLLETKQERDPS